MIVGRRQAAVDRIASVRQDEIWDEDAAQRYGLFRITQFGDSKEARLFRSPHRYIWPAELDLMAQLAGFDLENRYADWSGSEFTADSRSHVSVYRLPDVPSPA